MIGQNLKKSLARKNRLTATISSMSKLILVDGNAIMHRAYHALPALTALDGTPINAVYGFTTMLLKMVDDLAPTHIAVAFDRPEPTFRKQILATYQAHRPEMDDDLGVQFGKVKELLAAMQIPVYEKAGFEADDIIGTIATKASVDKVVIATGDKDILQLVGHRVSLYMPVKGLSHAQVFEREETLKKLGVTPEQIVDYKALVGDPSDNYKGVSGIGPKTAQVLLQKYRGLEDIYEHINEITATVRKKLVLGKSSAFESQKLAQIVTDIELDFDLNSTQNWQLDTPQVFTVCHAFGFKTIPKRIQALSNSKKLTSKNQLSLV